MLARGIASTACKRTRTCYRGDAAPPTHPTGGAHLVPAAGGVQRAVVHKVQGGSPVKVLHAPLQRVRQAHAVPHEPAGEGSAGGHGEGELGRAFGHGEGELGRAGGHGEGEGRWGMGRPAARCST